MYVGMYVCFISHSQLIGILMTVFNETFFIGASRYVT